MNIPDNLLKQLCKNVRFIVGTNCGGKTTMAKTLAEKHGLKFYSADEEYWAHRKLSDAQNQPQMNRPFHGWQEYFTREPADQAQWLIASMKEEMPFIVLDLIRLAQQHEKGVIADVHAMPETLLKISDPSRIVALTADDATIRKEYFGREDKNPILACIKREMDDYDTAKENVLAWAVSIANEERRRIKQANILTDQRDQTTDYDARLKKVETHLELN